MTNNPLECRYWTQTYNVNEKTVYYLQRDITDMVYDLHVER